MAADLSRLAQQVGAAASSNDLEAFMALLAPDVKWGPPDDTAGGCQDRAAARAWFEWAQQRGRRARVTEIVTGDDCLLLGLVISGDGREDEARWQVLGARGGRIVDIRGFEERAEAARRAGIER